MKTNGAATVGPGPRVVLLGAAAAVLAILLQAGPLSAGGRLTGAIAMVPRNAASSGGARLSHAGGILQSCVGEAGAGSFSGGGVKLHSGLMPLVAQPGSVTAITALSKSTGTLELSWTAPGSDGFLGDVINGFYRVDFSSDAGHVFSPTRFQLEFSTAVSAGAYQTLLIPGLEPNTTYYTRIYLADSRKFFAEDSRRSDESTLADLPVNPAFSSVFSSSVTISWLLPAGGAGAFGADASTTNFGALLPGGTVISSRTPDGIQLSMTIAGLNPSTDYFFKVASLNWQGEKNYAVVIATRTRPGGGAPSSVAGLSTDQDALRRTLRLSWANPAADDPQGVVVLMSTAPFGVGVADGSSYSPGQRLADGSLVRAVDLATSFSDAGLALDTTYYYGLYTRNSAYQYSVSVSTSFFLDLPPLAPASLSSILSADGTRCTLQWRQVTSSLDGTSFSSTAAPRAFELRGYEVFRATSVLNASWSKIAALPATAQDFVDVLPDPGRGYVYKVESVDDFGARDAAMAAGTDQGLYVFAKDNVTRLKIPQAALGEMMASRNSHNSDIVIRAEEQTVDPSQKVIRAVKFAAYRSPSGEPVKDFQFSRPEVSVSLKYSVVDGRVVPSAADPSAGIPASEAAASLGMYWYNGSKYVKLFGRVDPATNEVTVQSGLTGEYQIRSLLRTEGFHFDIAQITNKAITPNGDGLNDAAIFIFDNPKDSGFSGQIFDISGARVSEMSSGPVPNSLQWDGKANGRPVDGGVYVYQIRAEDKVFNGTLVVIR